MKSKFLPSITLLGAMLLLIGCQDDLEEVSPENRFIKIYNDEIFESAYTPLDIQQTNDGGYLILASSQVTYSDFGGIYILKTDSEGNFDWDFHGEVGLVSPVPGLLRMGNSFYFYCMDNTGLGTYLLRIDETEKTATVARVYPDLTFPLAASSTPDGGSLLLSYNRNNQSSALSKINSDLGKPWTNEFRVDENPDEAIFGHLTGTDNRLPFFTGSLEEGGHFFNGFFNFTLSVSFVAPSNGEQTGVLNGFRDKGAISALVHISSQKFAISHYAFGQNFLLSGAEVNPSEISNSSELKSNEFPELAPDARVQAKKINIEGKNVILFAADAKSNQVVLLAYDQAGGELLGRKHIGFGEGFEIANFIKTSDGGLAVLAKTYVAGRFPRVALFKLSPGDLKSFTIE